MKFFSRILLMCISLKLGYSGKENNVLDNAEFILPCQKSDPNIDECVLRGIENLRPYLIKGIHEIQFPSIDPLKINKLAIDNRQGLFSLEATFFNMEIKGASEYSIKSLKCDLSTYTVDIGIGIPKLDIRGNYDVKGIILRIPITSQGTFSSILYDIDVVVRVKADEVTNDKGIKLLKIVELALDFRLKKNEFNIHDEYLQRTPIGKTLIHLLNEYSGEIIEATRPTTASVLAHHFKEILNPVLSHLPLKIFLPDA